MPKRALLLCVMVAVCGVFALSLWPRPAAKQAIVEPPAPTARAKAEVEPVVARKPSRLQIAKIGVDAPVIPVGMLASGEMEAPSSLHDVGWHRLGVIPGAPGNAVLAGHHGVGGEKAVFMRLEELAVGDKVDVLGAENSKITFEVVEIQSFTTDTAPMEKIFGKSDEIRLNIITCDGEWDSAQNTYLKRLVVFTKKVS